MFDTVISLLHSISFETRSMCLFPVDIIHVRSRLFITRLLNIRQQWRIGSLMADRLFVVGCDTSLWCDKVDASAFC